MFFFSLFFYRIACFSFYLFCFVDLTAFLTIALFSILICKFNTFLSIVIEPEIHCIDRSVCNGRCLSDE